MNKPDLYLPRHVTLSSRVSGEENVFVEDCTLSIPVGGGYETGSHRDWAVLELSVELKMASNPQSSFLLSLKC